LACSWMPPTIARYEARHPDIVLKIVDVTADGIVDAVRRGDAEIGAGPDRPAGDEIERSVLMKVPIRLVCPAAHALAARRWVSWRQIRDQRWVLYSGEFSRALERALQAHDPGLSLAPVTEVAYLTTALALVGAGLGVTAAPEYAA